ncbi:uncharacterized protein LOC125831484 [Solanum verrucosum]|uniref:uncharacterized protein LOC125831484 n=1 Tax=Solanum verrucosum TaxID=315347 RepID=UPI0020D019E3|nr:uncharacterized protein LOC125831484 [Solanum verrucosum]
MAKSLENGYGVSVDVWDVTEENIPKKYEDGSVCLKKLWNLYIINNNFLFSFFGVLFSWELYQYTFSSISDQKPFLTLKKTFFYDFIPSKGEEEASKVNNTPLVATRELVEIRDLYPAPKIDWQIKKQITNDEIFVGMLMIPFIQMFEYILQYWTLDMAKILENGGRVCVNVWDVTEENVPKKYEGGSVFLRKLYTDDFSLSCIELFNGRRLGIGDEIGLYWDPRSSSLMFKFISHRA